MPEMDDQPTVPALREEPERHVSQKIGEVEAIADRLAFAYRRAMAFYVGKYNLSPAEAHEKVNAGWGDHRESLLETPARTFGWGDYQGLAEIDPALALSKWETIKEEAHYFVVSGQAAAEAVECSWASTPWERGCFAAVRNDLAQDWQPRGGMEQTLIDAMAQAWTLQLKWTAVLMQRSEGEMVSEGANAKYDGGRWEPPRVSRAEAVAEAAGMVDRWNRMFLRNLRALQNLRRLLPVPVIVNGAGGQVNIGQQQVNVSGQPEAF